MKDKCLRLKPNSFKLLMVLKDLSIGECTRFYSILSGFYSIEKKLDVEMVSMNKRIESVSSSIENLRKIGCPDSILEEFYNKSTEIEKDSLVLLKKYLENLIEFKDKLSFAIYNKKAVDKILKEKEYYEYVATLDHMMHRLLENLKEDEEGDNTDGENS